MNIDEINTFLENDFSTHITNILRIKNNFKNDNNEINKKKIELLIKFINVFEMKCSLIDNDDNSDNNDENCDNDSQNVIIDNEELNKDSDDNSDNNTDNGSNSTESLSDCEYDDDDNFKDELTNIYKRARLGLESARDNKGFSIEKKNNYSLVE